MTLRLLVISDLHTEFDASFVCQIALEQFDGVVAAGDIGSGSKGVIWLRRVFPNKPIFYVPGNHEYYNRAIWDAQQEIIDAAKWSNVIVLDQRDYVFEKYRFIGATLWTNFALTGYQQASMALARQGMADFSVIREKRTRHGQPRPFTPADSRARHSEGVRFIKRAIDAPPAGPRLTTIIITHHAPSGRSIHRTYVGDLLNPCFASDMDGLIQDWQPALWVHGHVHNSFDYYIGKTRVLCNPRGYPTRAVRPGAAQFENPAWNPNLIVEV